ncbi:MAG: hypothetical protein JW901_10285 [Dehalococcoidia bacterium]|nr:hypothetical protein [Dehalococcoidia bacterium]
MIMGRWYAVIFLVMLVMLTVSYGCGVKLVKKGETSSSVVSDARLSTEVDSQQKPVNPSNTFTVGTDRIYLTVKLNDAAAGTQVLAKLTYLGGEASSMANSTMYENSQTGGGSGYLAFAMKAPPGGFPQGNYSVSISAGGQELISIPFAVQNLSAQKGWPVINKFSASQGSVPAGQSVTLSWDVSDATRVTLQPEIGTVDSSGTRSVTPSVSTTYKLMASNDAGASSREVTVNVGAAVTGAADLVITDVWLEGCMVYYKIKNIGSADSAASTSYIYVNNLFPPLGGTSFTDTLKAGQEKSLVFSSYQWPWCGNDPSAGTSGTPGTMAVTGASSFSGTDASGYVDWSTVNHVVKVCADGENKASESNKSNNCMTKIWGILMDYNLAQLAHLATWKNSSGTLPDVGTEDSPKGAYIKMASGGLMMVPDQVPNGWIQGYWGYFYQDNYGGPGRTAYIQLPANVHLTTRVSLAANASGSDGVTFKVGLRDMSDSVTFLPGKTMTVPGQQEAWDIDLSDYEGQKVLIVLRVEAGASATKDYAMWNEVRLKQTAD